MEIRDLFIIRKRRAVPSAVEKRRTATTDSTFHSSHSTNITKSRDAVIDSFSHVIHQDVFLFLALNWKLFNGSFCFLLNFLKASPPLPPPPPIPPPLPPPPPPLPLPLPPPPPRLLFAPPPSPLRSCCRPLSVSGTR